eukprot:TRINITY_DN423_c0_g1_i2.p1 TRINITY_DN423_c0_g1~~TRINITY_DN423_c0_g1_i2.p1  ORF type:complete len:306 (-),score=49.29 TRINITY_DN423_c0_g1_i2:220-1137(-)
MATEDSVMAVIRASRPSFRNPSDTIAFAVHASFLASGYALTATGKQAVSGELASSSFSSSGQEEVGIDGWNELDDCYGFVYTKTINGSKKSVLVKCLVIGDKLATDALRLNDEKSQPVHLEINVHDYVAGDGGGFSNYGQLYKIFGTLVERLKSGVLSKLESPPKPIRSEIIDEPDDSQNLPSTGFSTEQPPYSSGLEYPPVPPFGSSDLLPGPAAGVYPSRGGFGIGGGMFVGPNDPGWHGMGGQPGFLGGGIPGVPSGARFDPYGPPGIPGFEPHRFVRDPRRPRPGGGTHPDLEHFQGPDYI